MPVEKLTRHLTQSMQVALGAASDRATDQYGAALDAAAQMRQYHSDAVLAASDRSRAAMERAIRDSQTSFDFARKVLDQGTVATKSIAAAKSPADVLQAQSRFFQSSAGLCASEVTASINRFFEALADWAAWPAVAKVSART